MIQRIQSIYLLLASIVSSTLFFFPFASGSGGSKPLFADGNLDLNDHIVLLILTIASSICSTVAIFLYRNRIAQMNMGKLAMFVILGLVGTASFLLFTSGADYSLRAGLFVPFLSLILVIMANRAINVDEKRVRDSNRIR